MIEPSGPFSAPPPLSRPLPSGPLTISRLLDRIFHLMRRHIRLFLTIAAVPTGALIVFVAIMFAGMFGFVDPVHTHDPAAITARMGPFFAVLTVLYVPFLLVYAVFEAAVTHAALQANAGITVSYREAYSLAWRNAGRYLWLQVLRILIIVTPIAVAAALIAAIAVSGPHWKAAPPSAARLMAIPGIVLVDLAALVYAIFALLRIALAYPACVTENLTAWNAVRRSLHLTRRAKGRIFVVGLVIYLLSYAAFFLLELALILLVVLGGLAGRAMHIGSPWAIAGIALAGLVVLTAILLWSAITWSAYATSLAVIYHDQRLRMEGSAPGLAPAE